MKSKTKKLAKAKADKYFSLYIRKRDANNQGICRCITCGTFKHYKSIHCGHFISRRHEATRYDEKNCASQCAHCNTFNQGEQFKFSLEIDQRYGKGTAESLLQKSRMLCKRNKNDYEEIADYYKNLIKNI